MHQRQNNLYNPNLAREPIPPPVPEKNLSGVTALPLYESLSCGPFSGWGDSRAHWIADNRHTLTGHSGPHPQATLGCRGNGAAGIFLHREFSRGIPKSFPTSLYSSFPKSPQLDLMKGSRVESHFEGELSITRGILKGGGGLKISTFFGP